MAEKRAGGLEKHTMRYVRYNTFHVLRFVFYVLLSLLPLYAQTQEPSEEQLESDLPDEVIAEVIDTTRIELEPRSRFSDPLVPELIHAIALYPKERLWNLPPTTTPQKAVRPSPAPPKNYRFHLAAQASRPESLFYKVLFAGRAEGTHGFVHLNRQQLGNARTAGRGDYHLDGIRGNVTHQYQELSEISFDVGLNLKALEWLPATATTPNPQKDLLLFRSDLNWQQQLSETTWSTLNLDTTLVRINHDESEQDAATDARFNFDMALSWPFLNPIHAGGDVEYFSAGDAGEIIARLYARDEFSPFGPFVSSIGVEAVSLREPDDTSEDIMDSQLSVTDAAQQTGTETSEDIADTQSDIVDVDRQNSIDTSEDTVSLYLNPSLALTTHINEHWLIRLEGLRTIARHRLAPLYFDTDYISLTPSLQPEKAWNERLTLKYHRGAKFEMNLSGFAKQIDNLVVLIPQTESPKENSVQLTNNVATELAWAPTNIDASIYGGQLLMSARIPDRLDLRFQYTHEIHVPNMGDYILYRPTDRIDLDIVYHLPSGFHAALQAELQGPRYIDTMTDEMLQGYLLLKPKLSKTIGNYIDAFVGGAFAVGEYRLLEMYALSQRNFDFGIELKF